MMKNVFIGTAAWNVPKEFSKYFEDEGSHLERYARTLNAVEINTSFHRHHKAETYQRWAETVPKDFRFSVKLFKGLTHEKRLKVSAKELKSVLIPIHSLETKWGCLLVQLPGSLAFQKKEAASFFLRLRELYDGAVAFEPRHASWLTDEALKVLSQQKISLVMADPDPFKGKEVSYESEIVYYRLHGSPQIYKSDYESETLLHYKKVIKKHAKLKKTVWCIFDNTTYGFATKNAVTIADALVTKR